MRRAYLIDRDGVGGGMEYIRRKIAGRPGDECRVFFSERGECNAAAMNAWGAEEIHANHLKALLQLFRNPFEKPRGRVVFTVHGIHLRKYDFLPKTPANRLKRFLRLALERRLYAKCHRIIALTETDAADIARLYGSGLHISVEPNSVADADFPPPRNLRYGQDEFAFVCIARFDFQKGQDLLVKAIALAQDALRRDGMRTLAIGAGATFDEVRRMAEREGVADLVEFAGEIPGAGAYMTCGRTLVSPSRWEGMPYLLLEAAARNRSVIATDCPGNREALAGHPDATLVKNNDAAALAAALAGRCRLTRGDAPSQTRP